jgi:drug/metabolite transporter (DMT)-like permease
VARGLGVALVPILALPLLGEWPSPLGAAGVGLVVAGVVLLQLAGRGWRDVAARTAGGGAGTFWAVLTGLMTACYSLVDKAGVALLHPVPYIGLVFAGMTVLLLPAVLVDRDALAREWRANRRAIGAACVMTLGAYLLVLFAFRLSKASYVVAAREVSIVLSALLGHVWLRERGLGPKLLGAAVVLGGVVCVALAR